MTAPLVKSLVKNAGALGLGVSKLKNGVTVIDAGIEAPGGLEAGRLITEICMGGLGHVNIRSAKVFARWSWHLDVWSSSPVLACLGSQYAGWNLSHGSGKEAFGALGSGPARSLGSKERLFHELNYRDHAAQTTMIIEVDKIPPVELTRKIADMCGVRPGALTLVLTPTNSLAGGIQVVGRVLEVALHKVHTVGFPLADIADGVASAPICPPAQDPMVAMGRTNDAVIFGGHAHLYVRGTDADAQALAQKLPSNSSRDFGRPFAEVFKEVNYDFYKVDPMLFSPARVAVTALKSGRTFHAGRLHEELLDRSFGAEK
ncbi:MAG TPA: methenyltetrahydromethanopterin cyclohydrolase [Gammaproteobacteria bacterium]|nr:methenyltetrahydromethanopterin cyclohydrolase [Gammaproteobacteria bacterium]